MTAFRMLNMTGTPISQTLEQIYERQSNRVVGRLIRRYGLTQDEAEDRASDGWLILTEKLLQNPKFLQHKSFGWITSFVCFRAMSSRERRYHQRTTTESLEQITRRCHKPHRTHDADFTASSDFMLDYSQAAHQIAAKYDNSPKHLWMLYIVTTGREKSESDWSNRNPSTGQYTNWNQSMCAAACELHHLDPSYMRKLRRLMQIEIQLAMPDYGV